jgi:hypothetical protein
MHFRVAIIGEEWEACFARVTARSLASWLPPGAEVFIPSELTSATGDLATHTTHVVVAAEPGFQGYAEIRERVLGCARDARRGLLLLAAGAVPYDEQPVVSLGSSYGEQRAFEWHAPTEQSGPTVLSFRRPLHEPPALPRHNAERIGALKLWKVEGARRYFQALDRVVHTEGSPIWTQYGSHRPIFVYNTNEFDEERIDSHDEYVILASGLLGLRLVLESEPASGARVIVYDINPDQLKWFRFLLETCGHERRFEELLQTFRAAHPDISLRAVEPHETANAARQAEWYAQHREQMADLIRRLEWEFVECDLWTNPAPLFNRLKASRKLFFMYLDLFMIWHVDESSPWVENHADIAKSLEEAVRQRSGDDVTFLPGPRSARFQLHPESPFAAGRRESLCT